MLKTEDGSFKKKYIEGLSYIENIVSYICDKRDIQEINIDELSKKYNKLDILYALEYIDEKIQSLKKKYETTTID